MQIEEGIPPAGIWMEHIQNHLPTKTHPRMVVLKTLLILLKARNFPDIIFTIPRIFADVAELNELPPLTKHELTNTAAGFSEVDDATAKEIQARLLELLRKDAPTDSLQAHFSATFGRPCVQTDLVGQSADNRDLMTLALPASLVTIDATEEFTMQTTAPMRDAEIVDAITVFYSARGYTVDQNPGLWGSGYVGARKADEEFCIGYTNFSGEPHSRVLVTVTPH